MNNERRHMKTLLDELTAELRIVIAEGCQVIPQPDGGVVRIPFALMDPEARVRFLDACVDFTAYVNRGMDPEEADRILTALLAEVG
jgi:hypothetical protein